MATSARSRLVPWALAALAALAFAAAIHWAQRAPDGPVSVPLDRVACARCGMLVSEAEFSGQLHTQNGDVLFYDDPGCLLLDAEQRGEDVRAHWFHALDSLRWLSAEEVGFALLDPTPMGYGLAAQLRGEGLLDREHALEHARARDAGRQRERP